MAQSLLKIIFVVGTLALQGFTANAIESEGGICLDCLTSSKKSAIQEIAEFGCDAQKMTQECQAWFKENPDDLKYAKDCSKPEAEKITWKQACKEAGIENWTEILDLLTYSAKAIEACDADMECKRNLAKEAFFSCKNKDGSVQYPCVDAKQLEDVYAGDLARKRDKVRTLALQDKSYREEIEKEGYQMPKSDGRGLDFSASTLKAMAEAKMKELGVKYACYNSAGYAHMACYAVASIVDPTIIAAAPGVIIKGGKWVSLAFKARKAGEVSEVAAVTSIGPKKIVTASVPNPQVAAWRLREQGKVAAADKIEQKLIADFNKAKIIPSSAKEVSPGGAQLVTLDNGMQGIWKPNVKGRASLEVATYSVNKHLGLNQVPLTVKKKLGDQDGSVQFFVESTRSVPTWGNFNNPDFLLLQDYLTMNPGRDVDNFFYHEGRPIAFGHRLAFSKERRYEGPNFPDRVDRILERKASLDKQIAETNSEIAKSQGLFQGSKLKKLEEQLRHLKNEQKYEVANFGGLGLTKHAAEKLEKTSLAEWKMVTKDLTVQERKEFLERKDKAVAAIKKARSELGDSGVPKGPHLPWDEGLNNHNFDDLKPYEYPREAPLGFK